MSLSLDSVLPDRIGGYRLVRVLGRDATATTALVHADGDARIVRVFAPGVSDAVMEAELAVHDALASGAPAVRQHVAALDDIVTLADGRLALVITAVTGPTLGDVLHARHGALEPGEAVTAIAPLVTAVEGAHEVGVTGLSLASRHIRFGLTGAPIIVTVSGAVAGPVLPHRFREHDPAHRDDHRAVAQLVRTVASATVAEAHPGMARLVATARADHATASALFDLATPIPIRLAEGRDLTRGAEGPGAERTVGGPTQHGEPTSATRPATVEPAAPVRDAVAATLGALSVPQRMTDTVVAALENVSGVGARAMARVRRRLRDVGRSRSGHEPSSSPPRPPIRRSYAVSGLAGGCALIVALVVALGGPSSGDADRSVSSESVSPSAIAEANGVAGGGQDNGESRRPLSDVSRAMPDETTRPAPQEWRPLVTELVRRWEECRLELFAAEPPPLTQRAGQECAAGAVQPGSPAAALFTATDERHDVLSAWLATGGEVVVIEQMGAAVLVDLVEAGSATTAASLLLMRSEAGWRIRDVRG